MYTVGQLIARLQQFPEDALVQLNVGEEGPVDLESVTAEDFTDEPVQCWLNATEE